MHSAIYSHIQTPFNYGNLVAVERLSHNINNNYYVKCNTDNL